MCDCKRVRLAEVDRKHVSSAEFCQIFVEEMTSLYKLAFFLTTNHERAKQCVLAALESSLSESNVHIQWGRLWSKRAVIKSAVAMTFIPLAANVEKRDDWEEAEFESLPGTVINAVTRLSPLERFVFVLSVMERLSLRECSVLLSCPLGCVLEAQVRALRNLPTFDLEQKEKVEVVRIPSGYVDTSVIQQRSGDIDQLIAKGAD